jgi:hypothetical protein
MQFIISILEHSQFILIFESLLLNLTYVSDIDLLFIKNLFFISSKNGKKNILLHIHYFEIINRKRKMKRLFTLLGSVAIIIVFFILLVSWRLPKSTFYVKGLLFNKPFESMVDAELAKQMLCCPNDSMVIGLFDKYKDKPLNTPTLSEISRTYSMDVASLYFVQRLYNLPQNKKAQDLYSFYIEKISSNIKIDELEKLKEHYIIFIPGMAYKDIPSTGAHFKRQRKLLTAYGIENELINTSQWGVIENNAYLITQRLKVLCQKHKKIILVSTSKGGLETAIVLSNKLTNEETSSIKAWISVGGILRGSPIADYFLKPQKTGIAKLFLWTKREKIDMVKAMSYKERCESFEKIKFPDHIKIIHYVGIPLSTKIRTKIKTRYKYMLPLGPNDGLTPLADELTEKGLVVSEVGLDHYFDDPNIDIKSIALALTCIYY